MKEQNKYKKYKNIIMVTVTVIIIAIIIATVFRFSFWFFLSYQQKCVVTNLSIASLY